MAYILKYITLVQSMHISIFAAKHMKPCIVVILIATSIQDTSAREPGKHNYAVIIWNVTYAKYMALHHITLLPGC